MPDCFLELLSSPLLLNGQEGSCGSKPLECYFFGGYIENSVSRGSRTMVNGGGGKGTGCYK